ncbi:MAG: GDSL-type esterase/lipase family protein, partial [Candidatus Omnitrophota bacterium]
MGILPYLDPDEETPYFRLIAGGLSSVEEALSSGESSITVPSPFGNAGVAITPQARDAVMVEAGYDRESNVSVSSPAQTSTSTAAGTDASEESVTMLCVGDSITHGEGATSDERGYRGYLEENLSKFGIKSKFTGSWHHPYMDSDPGANAHLGEKGARVSTIRANLRRDLDRCMEGSDNDKTSILIHAGTNDIASKDDISDADIDEWVSEIIGMLEDVEAYDDKHGRSTDVYVASIIPQSYYENDGHTEYKNGQIERFNEELQRRVSAYGKPRGNAHIVDMYKAFRDRYDWQYLYTDALHPNDEGYRTMAEAWARAISVKPRLAQACSRLSKDMDAIRDLGLYSNEELSELENIFNKFPRYRTELNQEGFIKIENIRISNVTISYVLYINPETIYEFSDIDLDSLILHEATHMLKRQQQRIIDNVSSQVTLMRVSWSEFVSRQILGVITLVATEAEASEAQIAYLLSKVDNLGSYLMDRADASGNVEYGECQRGIAGLIGINNALDRKELIFRTFASAPCISGDWRGATLQIFSNRYLGGIPLSMSDIARSAIFKGPFKAWLIALFFGSESTRKTLTMPEETLPEGDSAQIGEGDSESSEAGTSTSSGDDSLPESMAGPVSWKGTEDRGSYDNKREVLDFMAYYITGLAGTPDQLRRVIVISQFHALLEEHVKYKAGFKENALIAALIDIFGPEYFSLKGKVTSVSNANRTFIITDLINVSFIKWYVMHMIVRRKEDPDFLSGPVTLGTLYRYFNIYLEHRFDRGAFLILAKTALGDHLSIEEGQDIMSATVCVAKMEGFDGATGYKERAIEARANQSQVSAAQVSRIERLAMQALNQYNNSIKGSKDEKRKNIAAIVKTLLEVASGQKEDRAAAVEIAKCLDRRNVQTMKDAELYKVRVAEAEAAAQDQAKAIVAFFKKRLEMEPESDTTKGTHWERKLVDSVLDGIIDHVWPHHRDRLREIVTDFLFQRITADEATSALSPLILRTSGVDAHKYVVSIQHLIVHRNPDELADGSTSTAEGDGQRPQTVQELMSSLSSEVDSDLLYAISELGRMEEEVAPAIPGLIDMLSRDDTTLSTHIGDALGNIGLPVVSSIDLLIEAVRRSDLGYIGVAHFAALAFNKLGRYSGQALPALSEALRDDDPNVRQFAAMAIGNMGPAALSAMPDLIKALDDEHDAVHYYAAEALGKMGSGARGAIPRLFMDLMSANMTVTHFACGALIEIGADMEDLEPHMRHAGAYPGDQLFWFYIQSILQKERIKRPLWVEDNASPKAPGTSTSSAGEVLDLFSDEKEVSAGEIQDKRIFKVESADTLTAQTIIDMPEVYDTSRYVGVAPVGSSIEVMGNQPGQKPLEPIKASCNVCLFMVIYDTETKETTYRHVLPTQIYELAGMLLEAQERYKDRKDKIVVYIGEGSEVFERKDKVYAIDPIAREILFERYEHLKLLMGAARISGFKTIIASSRFINMHIRTLFDPLKGTFIVERTKAEDLSNHEPRISYCERLNEIPVQPARVFTRLDYDITEYGDGPEGDILGNDGAQTSTSCDGADEELNGWHPQEPTYEEISEEEDGMMRSVIEMAESDPSLTALEETHGFKIHLISKDQNRHRRHQIAQDILNACDIDGLVHAEPHTRRKIKMILGTGLSDLMQAVCLFKSGRGWSGKKFDFLWYRVSTWYSSGEPKMRVLQVVVRDIGDQEVFDYHRLLWADPIFKHMDATMCVDSPEETIFYTFDGSRLRPNNMSPRLSNGSRLVISIELGEIPPDEGWDNDDASDDDRGPWSGQGYDEEPMPLDTYNRAWRSNDDDDDDGGVIIPIRNHSRESAATTTSSADGAAGEETIRDRVLSDWRGREDFARNREKMEVLYREAIARRPENERLLLADLDYGPTIDLDAFYLTRGTPISNAEIEVSLDGMLEDIAEILILNRGELPDAALNDKITTADW